LAVEHYLADAEAPARELVVAALGWRDSAPKKTEEAVALLQRELVPLYLQYIDDHITRLAAAGRADLAESFGQWRTRLLA
jgi:hypothetical protein